MVGGVSVGGWPCGHLPQCGRQWERCQQHAQDDAPSVLCIVPSANNVAPARAQSADAPSVTPLTSHPTWSEHGLPFQFPPPSPSSELLSTSPQARRAACRRGPSVSIRRREVACLCCTHHVPPSGVLRPARHPRHPPRSPSHPEVANPPEPRRPRDESEENQAIHRAASGRRVRGNRPETGVQRRQSKCVLPVR